MEPRAKCPSVSQASSWRGRPLREYSPLFGRLPTSFQPTVALDADGEGICITSRRGRTNTVISRSQTTSFHTRKDSEAARTQTDLDYDELEDDGHASVAASTVALLKSTLGIGLVSMPHICQRVGVAPYVGLLFFFMLPSHFANLCLAHSTDLVLGRGGPRVVERADFITLGVLAFGPMGQWGILALFLVVVWGGTVALFIALWDILQGYAAHVSFLDSSAVFLPLMGLLCFPLCCLNTLNALRHTSYLGILGIASLAASLWYWAVKNANPVHDMHASNIDASALALLPVFIFSYVGQFNFIRVYTELKRRSPERINVVSLGSLVGSFAFYALTGIGGYLAFLQWTQEDVFKNYKSLSGVPTHGARILFAFSLFFTAPVYLFEARKMVEDMLTAFLESRHAEGAPLLTNEEDDEEDDEYVEKVDTKVLLRRAVVVAALLTSVVVVAVVYPHVTQVLGLLGATSSTIMMMVLPPVFLLRISKLLNRPLSPAMKLGCQVFAGTGFTCIPTFTSLVIWQLIDPPPAPSPMTSHPLPPPLTSSPAPSSFY